MQLGGGQPAPGHAPGPRPLLPGPVRRPAVAALAGCVAVTAALAVEYAGHHQPGRVDALVDPRVMDLLGRFPGLLHWLPVLGTLGPVALMTAALVLACLAARRWSGAVLAALAAPVATSLTEYVLKPLVGRYLGSSLTFPSGHATSTFALAVTCVILLLDPPRRRVPGLVRLLLAASALLLAATVAAAMVAMGAHYFTDAVAGAAVGTGVTLAFALALDWVASRRPDARRDAEVARAGARVPG